MSAAPRTSPVVDEAARLAALQRYGILDTEPEPVFDDLVARAARMCAAPMAVLSLVDARRQWFKARLGLDVSETPRAVAFCDHTIRGGDLLVVMDALQDPRFAGNPLVTGGPLIRFYAGAPLVTEDRLVIGTLSVIDRVPRDLTPEQRDMLRLLAALAMAHIELRTQAAHVRAATQSLAESESRYRSLFDGVPVGLFRSLPGGPFVEVNAAMVRLLGFPDRATLLSTDAASLWADAAERQAYLAVLHADSVVTNLERRFRRHDGTVIWGRLNAREVRSPDGTVLHYEGSLEDVTEAKRTSEALRQTEKVAAMGQLLAGIAHELNNPMSVVLGRGEILRERLRGAPLEAAAGKLVDAATRCARIIRNFLALARQRPAERGEVDLNEVVREALELVAYALRVDGVAVTTDLAPDLPDLWVDADQIHQVVVNLVTNAHQAMHGMPPPRRLDITTRALADRVVLSVSDSGPGIPAEHQPRIFEPFFTTKPPGQGTGLGLSLCQSFVEAHGGRIRVESPPGERGARFVVELPVEPRPESAPGPATLKAVTPVRGRRVLVVDDEAEVAAVLAEVLSYEGYAVDIAHEGREALDKVEAAAYDLVLCDVRMPGTGGVTFYEALARSHPALARKFVVMTGDVLTEESRAFVEELERRRLPRLHKPFAMDDVIRVVGLALRGD